jgi:lipopolysaccharide transport system ATP-binding protein
MSKDVILKVENLSKQYRLGVLGTGTISHDLNRFIARIRGKEDPYLKIGESNDRSSKGKSEYVWALKDINFEVKRGEVLGIIGKNGAGKSTLLKILSKVTGPTTGSIKSKGRIASLLEVGTGFHPEMTGKENIFLNGAILGMTKKEIVKKLDEIVDFSGCERYIDTPVKRYSSGMKVRLAFAVAAFLEPDILVIDEVLAVGDVEFQKKAIGKMQDISNTDGRTVLFVSHDMAAIKNLCSRLIVLNNGVKSFEGTVDLGISNYLITPSDEFDEKKLRSGNIQVKSINIYKDEQPIQIFEAFCPVTIKTSLEFINSIPIDLKVEFFIVDTFGQTQTTISSWLNLIRMSPKKTYINVESHLKTGFSLIAGEYFICLKITDNISEYFQNILSFELMNSELTGYKFPMMPNIHGRVYTPNDWKY